MQVPGFDAANVLFAVVQGVNMSDQANKNIIIGADVSSTAFAIVTNHSRLADRYDRKFTFLRAARLAYWHPRCVFQQSS